jgi:hypothetical protein
MMGTKENQPNKAMAMAYGEISAPDLVYVWLQSYTS